MADTADKVPFFSVIVPVHNAGATLHDSVGSILSQSFADWELLLAENASTDDSREIVRAFAEAFPGKICALYADTPGVSLARNAALAAARGRYVLFLDADDHYLANALAHFSVALRQSPCDFLVSTFPDAGSDGSGTLVSSDPRALYLALLDRPLHADRACPTLPCADLRLRGPWAKAYRRSFLEEHALRFDLRCTDQEDLLFNAAVLRHARTAAVLDRATYRYIPRSGSASQRTDAPFLRSTVTAASTLLSALPAADAEERAALRYRVFRMTLLMVEACQTGQDAEAAAVLKAFLRQPDVQAALADVRSDSLFLNSGRDRHARRILGLLRAGRTDEALQLRTERISIVVPVYNIAAYLPRCADSLLGQTHRNIEVILVDDGSTDGCAEICDALAGKDARVCAVHQPNRGLSAARNAGLERATGRYVAFVDGDDFVEPDYVERLYRALADAGADMSVCSIRCVGTDGAEFAGQGHFLDEAVVSGREVLTRHALGDTVPWVVAWNKLYRRKLFGGLRYPEGKLHEDEFLLHALYLRCHRVATVTAPLYNYVRRPGSIMDDATDPRRLDAVEALLARASAYAGMEGFRAAAAATLRRAERLIARHRAAAGSQSEAHRLRLDKLEADQRDVAQLLAAQPAESQEGGCPASVIVPVYNVGELLDDCLHSLLAQELPPQEIILVDDGSTDDSAHRCDDYAARHAHIRALHQSHQGQAAARNLGVREAHGEYVVFVDADDTVPPDHLSYLFDLKQRLRADIALAAIRRNAAWDDKERLLDAAGAVRALFRFRHYSPCALLLPAAIARRIPFPEGRVCEDLAVLPQLVGTASRVAFSTRVSYHYRRRPGSTMTTLSAKRTADLLLALADCHRYVSAHFPTAMPLLLRRMGEKILEEHDDLAAHAPDVLREALPQLRDAVRSCAAELMECAELSEAEKQRLRDIGGGDNPIPNDESLTHG